MGNASIVEPAESEYSRTDELETDAYLQFIHTDETQKILV